MADYTAYPYVNNTNSFIRNKWNTEYRDLISLHTNNFVYLYTLKVWYILNILYSHFYSELMYTEEKGRANDFVSAKLYFSILHKYLCNEICSYIFCFYRLSKSGLIGIYKLEQTVNDL
jgi:hypothetical protein